MTRVPHPPRDGGLSPEWSVLLAGARVRPTASDGARLQTALKDGVDVPHLLRLASYHGVAHLLLHSLRSLGVQAATSPALLMELSRANAANALRNALLFEDLAAILASAERNRLDVIVLKGAALAETVYGDRSRRPMRDVDLLIRDEHLAEFEQHLATRGYLLGQEWAHARQWHRDHDYHLAYYKRPDGLPTASVELHWHLESPSRPFRVDLDGLWMRALPATVAGVRAKVLSAEDTLLHLCIHACRHGLTAGLRAYCDIAEVVRHHSERIDWPAVTRRACEWRVNGYVYLPLALSRELLDAPVPDSALDALIPDSFDRGLLELAKAAVLEDPRSASLFPDFFALTWGRSLTDRRVALARALAPRVVAARYASSGGSSQIWRRYPHRIVHLCRSYGPELWRFLCRGRHAVAAARERAQLARFLRVFEPLKRSAGSLTSTARR